MMHTLVENATKIAFVDKKLYDMHIGTRVI